MYSILVQCLKTLKKRKDAEILDEKVWIYFLIKFTRTLPCLIDPVLGLSATKKAKHESRKNVPIIVYCHILIDAYRYLIPFDVILTFPYLTLFL